MNKLIGLFSSLILIGLLTGAAFADKVYFYHTDPAGTPIAMSNDTGAIVWKATYKPFGEEQAVTGSIVNDKKFVGKEKDEETGLDYFGARYLKDKIGRFLSPDPVGPVDPRTGKINQKMLANSQRLNPYAYALNNPYRYVDPDGLELIPIWLPGVGNTFLDDQFAPLVNSFMINAHEEGVDLTFNSAYRTPEQQERLRNDPNAITPADNSLHSAGFAVDVNYSSLGNVPGGLTGNRQREIIRNSASGAGLDWGGNFRRPDPPHFYDDPGGDRALLIENATSTYEELRGE